MADFSTKRLILIRAVFKARVIAFSEPLNESRLFLQGSFLLPFRNFHAAAPGAKVILITASGGKTVAATFKGLRPGGVFIALGVGPEPIDVTSMDLICKPQG